MSIIDDCIQDTMQVCRNGHVITDLLRSCPERARTHCDRCGAVTIDCCPTCGHELSGAFIVPGLQPMGARPAPAFCDHCGAAFPWAKQRRPPKREALLILENFLRRLPGAIRQLRTRQEDRPPFRVVDERDLEDLVRALLPLYFDDIRPESRTPSYSAGTRTDFLLAPEGIALTLKLAQSRVREQAAEDAAYYRVQRKCRTLVVFIYDPQTALRESDLPPPTGAETGEEPEVRCVLGAS